MHTLTSRVLGALLITATAGFAQTRSLHTLRLDSAGTARISSETSDCGAPQTRCTLTTAPGAGFAGGLAHAPSRDTLWYSTGRNLVEVTQSCNPSCTTAAALALGRQSIVGGLTVSATRNELYQVESTAGQAVITTYSLSFQCPIVTSTTPFALPTGLHRAGAIAYDGASQHLFVAASIFAGSVPVNVIYVFRPGRQGGWLQTCTTNVDPCNGNGVGPIQAMAYDECRGLMWLADATRVYEQDVSYRTACPTFTGIGCCGTPRNPDYHGLDVEVGVVRNVGSGCTPRGCGDCSGLNLEARGRPIVGNSQFQLRINDGPLRNLAYVVLSPGPCSSTRFGCGHLFPSLTSPWIPLALGPLMGNAPCQGSALASIAVPPDYSLCGQLFCSQGIVVCGSGAGFALTNGIVFAIEG